MNHKESPQDLIKPIIKLFFSGQVEESLDAVEVLIKNYPNEPLLFNICGVFYKEIGQLNKAVKRFKKALAINPDYAEAHNNLGVTLQNLDLMDAAAKSYEKAIAFKPDYAEAHNNLGVTLQNLGLMDAAAKSYEKAVAFKPDYIEALNNLGNILLELRQLETAIESYEKVIAIKPDYAEAHNNLGVTLQELGRLDMAVKSYKKALAIKPDYAEAHNNLGATLQELGQLDMATKNYEKALAIEPDYAEANNNLGNILRELGQLDMAVKSYEKALAIKPDYAVAHYNLGVVLKEFGQRDTAVKSFEKALAIQPNYVKAHLSLSILKEFTENDSQITLMQSLLSNSNLSQSDRIKLCFALAKANDNLGNQDELFKYLHEGNRLRKEELNYSLDKSKDLFSFIKELFSALPTVIEQSLSFKPSTKRPIFIVGMPRSGTTLVEQIISSHHAVHGAGELTTLPTLIGPIVKNHITHGSSIASTTIGDKKMNIANTYNLPGEAFLSIREKYLDALSNLNVPESVITDKLPLNFQYIGFILSAFPEAKIVHLKRDARATCWSNYQCFHLKKENGFSYNLDDLAEFYGLYLEQMDFWHQLYPGQIYDICYEDLTTHQEEETQKLLQYCELDWDENCLNFHKNPRAVKTASSLQVKQKMYQGSSEAWKKHEAYLKPLIKNLSSF
jgi:tetratricopeptide (TPR) repeat protein